MPDLHSWMVLMEPIPVSVNLPDPVHSHWDPGDNRFIQHEHTHAGPHTHEVHGERLLTIYDHGSNYSPRPLPS